MAVSGYVLHVDRTCAGVADGRRNVIDGRVDRRRKFPDGRARGTAHGPDGTQVRRERVGAVDAHRMVVCAVRSSSKNSLR